MTTSARPLPLSLLLILAMALALAFGMTDAEWSAARRAAIDRPRLAIWDADGCDAMYYPVRKAVTPENFKWERLADTAGTEISSIFYCPISSGFCNVTLATDVGDRATTKVLDGKDYRNITADLFALGTDTLRLAVEHCREQGMEIFCSFRMNDTHDNDHRATKPAPLFPQFKKDHPEVLMGSEYKAPPYCAWTAVDFTQDIVRQRFLALAEETCQRYDIDGICCDFMRHTQLLKSVAWGGQASQEELDLITGMMQQLHDIAEREGRRRGKPILIAVRVPDSVEYCRGVGIDIETWLKRGLVELLSTTSYFQLNPWSYSVALARKYGVKYYAALDESRIRGEMAGFPKRMSNPGYAAQALTARRAGADGIYYFNMLGAGALSVNGFGSVDILAHRSKVYYATVRGPGGYRPVHFLKGGFRHDNMPALDPQEPAGLSATGRPLEFDLDIGDDLGDAGARELLRGVSAGMKVNHPELDLTVTINGQLFHKSAVNGDVLEYRLPPEALKCGRNHIAIANASAGFRQETVMETILKGDEILVFGKNQGLWRRFFNSVGGQESVVDGAYCIEDNDSRRPRALYHPLVASGGDIAHAKFTLRLLSSDDPDAMVARLADGRHIEVVQFLPGRVALKFAKTEAPFDTTGAFHDYELTMDDRNFTVLADGKPLLAAPLAVPASDPQYEMEGVAGRTGLAKVQTEGLVIGSLSTTGTGAALWKDVALDNGGIIVSDFAIRIDYAELPPAQLQAVPAAEFTAVAEIGVREGKPYASPGVQAIYDRGYCTVAPDGKSLILNHECQRNPHQRFNLAAVLPEKQPGRIFIAEWTAQPLQDGANGEPCYMVSLSPRRVVTKGCWDFTFKVSTKGISTSLGDLPADRFPPAEPHRFRYAIDTHSGVAALWCDGQLALTGRKTIGFDREKPSGVVGDASGGIAGQARLENLKLGYAILPDMSQAK